MPTRYSLVKARDEVICSVVELIAAEKFDENHHSAGSLAHREMVSENLDKALSDYCLTAFDLASGKGEK